MPIMRDQAGQLWEVDASGNPVRRVSMPTQQAADPYKAPTAAADLRGKTLDNQGQVITNNRTAAMTPYDVQVRQLEAEKLQFELEKMRREQEAASGLTPQAMSDVENEAMKKLRDIETIGKKMGTGVAAVGSIATPFMNGIPGTDAYDLNNAAGRLAKAGALQKIMDMTKATGKNPFTPMSNSDVQLIADTNGSLDPNLSRDEFGRMLSGYQDAYTNAYAGAVGQRTLQERQQFQYDKYVRENPNATPAQRKRFMEVLQSESRKRYDTTVQRQRDARQAARSAPRVTKTSPVDDEVAGYLAKYGAR